MKRYFIVYFCILTGILMYMEFGLFSSVFECVRVFGWESETGDCKGAASLSVFITLIYIVIYGVVGLCGWLLGWLLRAFFYDVANTGKKADE